MRKALPLMIGVGLALGTAVCASAHADSNQQVKVEIRSELLRDALNDWAQQTGFNLISQTSSITSQFVVPAINGELTARAALERLLSGTSLTYELMNDRTVVIKERSKSSVTSTGWRKISDDSRQHVALAKEHQQQQPAGGEERVAQPGTPKRRMSTTYASNDKDATRLLEEVVVTAQKREQRIQDVPIPVAVVSAETLTVNNQLRVQDYYRTVPGLGLALTGNGGEPVVTIRGITTGGNTNPTVGVVIDDVPYGATVATGSQTPIVPDIDPGDLSHVEVLRGPQGTLYGASSIGGLLKFMTVDPSPDQLSGRAQVGSVSVAEGDDYGYNARGAVNVPVTDDFAIRAGGFTSRTPGYVDNAQTGERDINRRDSNGGRLSGLWRPSEKFSLKVNALFQDSKRRGPDDVDTLLGDDPKQSFLQNTGLYTRKVQAFGATMNGRVGGVEWTSATGYSVDKMDDAVDSSTNVLLGGYANSVFNVNRVATEIHSKVDKLSQELRATVPIGSSVSWLFGAFYTDESTTRANDNQAADTRGTTFGTLLKTEYHDADFEEYAAFTNVTVNFGERWEFQLGGRASHNRQEYPVIRSGPVALALFGADPQALAPLKSKDDAFTYLVTPQFKVSDDLMVYLRAASGYRPGGPNSACGVAGIPCGFDPDTTTNYDLGVKGNFFEGVLNFDASVYYIDWRDIQIAGISVVGTTFTYTGNVSRAKSQGAELSLDTKPLEGLMLSAWVAYDDAELKEPFPPGQLLGRPGDRLPYSSRLSGFLSADQEFPLGASLTGFFGTSVSYVGDRKGTFQRTAVRETFPSYTQWDLRGGARYDSWTINAFVNNLTNKRGILRSGIDAIRPTYFTYIEPRTFGFSVTKTF